MIENILDEMISYKEEKEDKISYTFLTPYI